MMKFVTADVTNNVTNNVTNLSARQNIILNILANHGKSSTAAIAKELNVEKRTILRDIAELQQLGVLVREGGTRGHWVVTMGKSE